MNTLERDGLVTRRPSAGDRRAVDLELTDAGREAIISTYSAHNKREQTWTETLTPSERVVLIGLLEKMASGTAAREAVKRS